MRAHCEGTLLDGKVDRPFRRAGRRAYRDFQNDTVGPGPDLWGLSTCQRVNAHARASHEADWSPAEERQSSLKLRSEY
jgi:hypothetical protein